MGLSQHDSGWNKTQQVQKGCLLEYPDIPVFQLRDWRRRQDGHLLVFVLDRHPNLVHACVPVPLGQLLHSAQQP